MASADFMQSSKGYFVISPCFTIHRKHFIQANKDLCLIEDCFRMASTIYSGWPVYIALNFNIIIYKIAIIPNHFKIMMMKVDRDGKASDRHRKVDRDEFFFQ